MRGAGTARRHFLERPSQGARQIDRVVDDLREFRQWPEHGLLIKFGERITPPPRDRNIGRNGQDRYGRFVGLDHARRDIGRPTAGRTFADADAAGNPRIGVRHICSVSFVTRQHMGQVARRAIERIIEWQASIAAQSKDNVHAMQFEHPDQCFTAGNLISRHVSLPHQFSLR